MARGRDVYVIDFAMKSENEARHFAVPFDLVRSRVKPERDGMRRDSRRKYWWRFGEPNPKLRRLVADLTRYIATPYVAKHRPFMFLDARTAPDDKVVVVGSDQAWILGVLSSAIHGGWALAAGSLLEDRPTYNNPRCFDPFPFPDPPAALRAQIATLAESLDAHRAAAIARDERVTMTGMYNVVEKLRSGDQLTPKERTVHELAACGILRDMHDQLDALVAEAYGWSWPLSTEEILDKLVALHDVRVAEEAQGIVRWLRPEFQAPQSAMAAPVAELALTTNVSAAAAVAEPTPWPAQAIEQISALKRLVTTHTLSVDDAMQQFSGARRELVERHLETLAILGEVRVVESGRYSAVAAF